MSTEERHPEHQQHAGERYVQKKLNIPLSRSYLLERMINTNIDHYYGEFYEDAEYFAVSTLDSSGRPWVSLAIDSPLKVISNNEMFMKSNHSKYDPFISCFNNEHNINNENHLFAGLVIDFQSQSRIKIAGEVLNYKYDSTLDCLQCRLKTYENHGNCPKYITKRKLMYKKRIPTLVSNVNSAIQDNISNSDSNTNTNTILTKECKEHINKVRTLFLASPHTAYATGDTGPDAAAGDADSDRSDIGLNHRGGNPGFVRVYDEVGVEKDPDTFCSILVIPDYSGNKFYQTLGNVQSSKLAGLVLPDFVTGNMLYITGIAENLFDDEAELIMPRVKFLTKIRITGYVMVNQGLNLTLMPNTTEILSAYNPIIKSLASELGSKSGRALSLVQNTCTATLVDVHTISNDISTFIFELSDPIQEPTPGSYIILDISQGFDRKYQHMNARNPQSVNDDYVRTWTISHVYSDTVNGGGDGRVVRVGCTIKCAGTVSRYLHSMAVDYITTRTSTSTSDQPTPSVVLTVPVVGLGGGFSCFPNVPPSMVWIAGGVGLTPFIAMLGGIVRDLNRLGTPTSTSTAVPIRIVLYYACRGSDYKLLTPLLDILNTLPVSKSSDRIQLDIKVYDSSNSNSSHSVRQTDLTDLNKSQSPNSDSNSNSSVVIYNHRLTASDINIYPNPTTNPNPATNPTHIYTCGPTGLMQMVSTLLSKSESESESKSSVTFPKEQFHQESYTF